MPFTVTAFPDFAPSYLVGTFTTRDAAETAALSHDDCCYVKPLPMITFHPSVRMTLNGFVPMVTLRAAKGRMVGSKVAQGGNVFETAQDAFDHALNAARRCAHSLSFDHGVFAVVAAHKACW